MSNISQENIDPQLLEEICQCYNIAVSSLHFIIAVDHNFVFSFQKEGKEYILRGGTRHSSDQVLAELEWVRFLDSYGLKVSVPILSVNNKYLELIEHGDKLVNAIVFERAPGRSVDWKNPDEWNEYLWENMGRTLGKMHAASIKYNSIQPKFIREAAIEKTIFTAESQLDPVKDSSIIQRFDKLRKKLSQLPKDNNAYGVIQYDFQISNFNIHDGEITVFDFDDSYYFFFLYDIATCIHETVWYYPEAEKLAFANRFIPALWKGYSEEYTLDRKWLKYLPDFFKWREIDIYVILVESYKDKTTPEKYMREIEEYLPEFKRRFESDEQIVPIPVNLEEWFKKF